MTDYQLTYDTWYWITIGIQAVVNIGLLTMLMILYYRIGGNKKNVRHAYRKLNSNN